MIASLKYTLQSKNCLPHWTSYFHPPTEAAKHLKKNCEKILHNYVFLFTITVKSQQSPGKKLDLKTRHCVFWFVCLCVYVWYTTFSSFTIRETLAHMHIYCHTHPPPPSTLLPFLAEPCGLPGGSSCSFNWRLRFLLHNSWQSWSRGIFGGAILRKW